jgi:hypothetical protein
MRVLPAPVVDMVPVAGEEGTAHSWGHCNKFVAHLRRAFRMRRSRTATVWSQACELGSLRPCPVLILFPLALPCHVPRSDDRASLLRASTEYLTNQITCGIPSIRCHCPVDDI